MSGSVLDGRLIDFAQAVGDGFDARPTSLNPQQFGAVADGVTDDYLAFAAMFAAAEVQAIAGSQNPTLYRGAPEIRIPRGAYYCSQSLQPLSTVRIRGDGGLGWGAATQIRFPDGVSAIITQAHNTSGVSTVDGPHFAGYDILFQDIYFIGGFAGTEGEYHGIHAKRTVHVERCTFDNFSGDGFHAYTTGGAGDATEGNTNTTRLTNVVFTNCRSGVFTKGADANAMALNGCSFILNRRFGIEERSFLGNHSFGHHFDSDGRTSWNSGASGHPCSYVHYSGHWYFAIDGQETGASTNAPSGTTADNTWWGYWQDGVASPSVGVPTWTNGISVRSGGPLLASGASNNSTFSGIHVEPSGVCQIDDGIQLSGNIGLANYASVVSGVLTRNRGSVFISSSRGLTLGGRVEINGLAALKNSANQIGPSQGATVQDGISFFGTRNNNHVIQGALYDAAGTPTYLGSVGFFSGFGTVYDVNSGAYVHQFRINGTGVATFDTSGILLKPVASVTPAANGDMRFELTSNTQLKIKVKGSDGTVRSVSLTLA